MICQIISPPIENHVRSYKADKDGVMWEKDYDIWSNFEVAAA